jgi:hypothetical protein
MSFVKEYFYPHTLLKISFITLFFKLIMSAIKWSELLSSILQWAGCLIWVMIQIKSGICISKKKWKAESNIMTQIGAKLGLCVFDRIVFEIRLDPFNNLLRFFDTLLILSMSFDPYPLIPSRDRKNQKKYKFIIFGYYLKRIENRKTIMSYEHIPSAAPIWVILLSAFQFFVRNKNSRFLTIYQA